jgi:putative aldouronate transport system permease protein
MIQTIKYVGAKKHAVWFDVLNVSFLTLLSLVMIIPFYCVLVGSVSPKLASTDLLGRLIPREWDFSSYIFAFEKTALGSGFRNTLFITAVGVPFNLILTLGLAYSLSKKWLWGRNVIMNMVIFTMFFGGGLIPFYLLMTNALHLRDSLWAVILPYGVNTFNMIIMKNFFQSLPQELEESAYLDGANDLKIFFIIILPLSLPLLATFTLFFSVDRWNEWWNSMLFSTKQNNKTMQLVLRELVVNVDALNQKMMTETAALMPMLSMSVKCAVTVLTVVPIMCVYPLLQRYYMKGLLIGAIKS